MSDHVHVHPISPEILSSLLGGRSKPVASPEYIFGDNIRTPAFIIQHPMYGTMASHDLINYAETVAMGIIAQAVVEYRKLTGELSKEATRVNPLIEMANQRATVHRLVEGTTPDPDLELRVVVENLEAQIAKADRLDAAIDFLASVLFLLRYKLVEPSIFDHVVGQLDLEQLVGQPIKSVVSSAETFEDNGKDGDD